MTVRVVLADDQEMVRAGLRMLIDFQPDLEVVGEAADGLEAVDVVARTRPDVVLMDVRMPRCDGLEAARRVLAQSPDVAVVVLTTFDEDASLAEALRAGVSGFLLKTAPPEQLLQAVRTVAAGNGLLDPAVTLRVIAAGARSPAPDPSAVAKLASLTARETEVLRLVAEGLTNAEIAARLYLGEATVKTYLSRMLTKLDLRDRVQAVAFAFRSGLVPLG
ncbi:response regulator [Geodermatophilus sp. SYSU D00815]